MAQDVVTPLIVAETVGVAAAAVGAVAGAAAVVVEAAGAAGAVVRKGSKGNRFMLLRLANC